MFVYVDAALDAGVYRLGLFSLGLGSRSNQQCAEARALLWGLQFILNVGYREAHLFGDNAAALIQYLRCKAGNGRTYHQRLLKSFRYLWASCPVLPYTVIGCGGRQTRQIPLVGCRISLEVHCHWHAS